jgi:hypothetical protein
MFLKSLRYWLPIILVFLSSIVLVSWGAYQETQIQGSVFLPGGFSFAVYLPSRYAAYCDMDVYPENAAKHASNIRLLPKVVCEVKGAGHLNVLNIPVWRSGGLTRYTKAPDDSTRVLIPFAEFDILWPGIYEIRATFISPGNKHFLISVGPTSLITTTLIVSIIFLAIGLAILLKRKLEMSIVVKSETREMSGVLNNE